jgi:ribosome-associated translation inhibitor RaiA
MQNAHRPTTDGQHKLAQYLDVEVGGLLTQERWIMDTPDFDYEFYSDIAGPVDELRGMALDRLLRLKGDHDDMVGASVALEELTRATTPHAYRVRIAVYVRPKQAVVSEEAETPEGAMKSALEGVERMIREMRDRLREQWKQP